MLIKLPDEDFFDPEIEWDASEVPVLDISGVYRGIEAVRESWRVWFAAWKPPVTPTSYPARYSAGNVAGGHPHAPNPLSAAASI